MSLFSIGGSLPLSGQSPFLRSPLSADELASRYEMDVAIPRRLSRQDLLDNPHISEEATVIAWSNMFARLPKEDGAYHLVFEQREGTEVLEIKNAEKIRLMMQSCSNQDELVTLTFKQARFSPEAFNLLVQMAEENDLIYDIEFKYCILSDDQLAALSRPRMRAKISSLGISWMRTEAVALRVVDICFKNDALHWLQIKNSVITVAMAGILAPCIRTIKLKKFVLSDVVASTSALQRLASAVASQKELDTLSIKDIRFPGGDPSKPGRSNLKQWDRTLTGRLTAISFARSLGVDDQSALERLEHAKPKMLNLSGTGIVDGKTISKLIAANPALHVLTLKGTTIGAASLRACIQELPAAPRDNPLIIRFIGTEKCLNEPGTQSFFSACVHSKQIDLSIAQKDKLREMYAFWMDERQAIQVAEEIQQSTELTQEHLDKVYKNQSCIKPSGRIHGVEALLAKSGLRLVRSETAETDDVDSIYDRIKEVVSGNSWVQSASHLKLRVLAELYISQGPLAYKMAMEKDKLALPVLAKILERPIAVFDGFSSPSLVDGKLESRNVFLPDKALYPMIRLYRDNHAPMAVRYHSIVEQEEH